MVVAGFPTGTVTFLFTDLEGTTRLWEEHPESMQLALARHYAILRDAVEASGGQVIKTTGDGLHAVFETAEAA
jgi:class 3 adenylate cyclase